MSALGSHVPFEPSVQHEVVHDASGRRPLGERGAARRTRRRRDGRRSRARPTARRGPTVTRRPVQVGGVGCRARRTSRRAVVGADPAAAAGPVGMPAVGDRVDVDRQARVVPYGRPPRRRAAARRGGRSSRRRRRRGARATSAGADTLVPSSSPVGDERDGPRSSARSARPLGQRQVAVGDDDMVDALARHRVDAVIDGAVEPEARAPRHLRRRGPPPIRRRVVVARHEHRQRRRGGEHALGHPARRVAHARSAGQPRRRAGAWRRGTT